MQLFGRGFELVDFVGREGIAGLFVPVGLAVHDIVVEAEFLDLVLPARPRRYCFTTHVQLAPLLEPEPPVEPKPPRWLCVAAGAVLLVVGDVVVVAVLLPVLVLVLVAAPLPGDGVLMAAGPRKNGLGNSQRYGKAPKPAPTPGVQE